VSTVQVSCLETPGEKKRDKGGNTCTSSKLLATSMEIIVLSGYRACTSTVKLVVNVFVLTVDLDLHADLAGLSE
jgi:hypothetical protein